MWNLGYDRLLEGVSSRGTCCYAYADDTLLLISTNKKDELEELVEKNITAMQEALAAMNLELNIPKTEVVVFGNIIHTSPINITVRVSENAISSSHAMKYLGVMIDWRLEWHDHVDYLGSKTEKVLPKIIALCQNTYGYSTYARKIMLQGTVGAYFRYGSTCFATALLDPKNLKKVNKIHQRMNVCIGRIYKTASYLGSCAITGQPPLVLDLLARSIATATKKGWTVNWYIMKRPADGADVLEHLDQEIRRVWQLWWNNCPSGAWTRKLIPKVSFNTPETDFYTAQALSGHGCFREYRKRIKKIECGVCPRCLNVEESAEHVLQDCPRFLENRPMKLDWQEPDTMKYLHNTVSTLWAIEQAETRHRSRGNTQAPLPTVRNQRDSMIPASRL